MPPPSTAANGRHPDLPEYTIQSFKPLLSKLLKDPDTYTPQDMRLALEHLASGQIAHAQSGSFLATLKVTEVWRRPEMIEVLVRTMDQLSGKVKVGGHGHVCDWTWTGESALSVRCYIDGVSRGCYSTDGNCMHCMVLLMMTSRRRTYAHRS